MFNRWFTSVVRFGVLPPKSPQAGWSLSPTYSGILRVHLKLCTQTPLFTHHHQAFRVRYSPDFIKESKQIIPIPVTLSVIDYAVFDLMQYAGYASCQDKDSQVHTSLLAPLWLCIVSLEQSLSANQPTEFILLYFCDDETFLMLIVFTFFICLAALCFH